MAVSPNEKQIFASGVDPLVVSLEVARIKDTDEDMDGGREFTWRRSWGHKMHSHDVRGLEIVNNLLLSAGVDTRVVVAKQKRKEGDISKVKFLIFCLILCKLENSLDFHNSSIVPPNQSLFNLT